MKKKFFLFLVIFLFSAIFFGCQYGLNFLIWGGDDVDNRWDSEKDAYTDMGNFLTVEKDSYTFLLFTDIHYGKSGFPQTSQLLDFLDYYAKENPDDPLRFVFFLGDAAEKGLFEGFRDYHNLEKEIMEKIKTANIAAETKRTGTEPSDDFLNLPRLNRIVTLLGNHDLYNEGFDIWRLQTYPGTPGSKFTVTTKNGVVRSYYNFDTASSVIGSKQYNFYKPILRGDDNKKIILSHVPLHQMGLPKPDSQVVSFLEKDRLKVLQLLLENDVDFYFSGHVHPGGIYEREEFIEYNFKSYTECQGNHCFYTVTVDEGERKVTISCHKNISPQIPSSTDVFKF